MRSKTIKYIAEMLEHNCAEAKTKYDRLSGAVKADFFFKTLVPTHEALQDFEQTIWTAQGIKLRTKENTLDKKLRR